MRKSTVLLSSIILIIGSVFLLEQNKKMKYTDIEKESSTSTSIISENKVIIDDNQKKNNVLFFFTGDAVLKHLYTTIDEMNESDAVDNIIKGIITDIDYIYADGLASSILTVNVLDSYKGSTTKEIKVYEDGGYVKVKDMIDEFNNKGMDLEKDLSKEQIENGLVDMKIFNAPHSEEGQQVILYLNKNKHNNFIDNSYSIISSVFGKFTLDENTGQYKRLSNADIPNFEDSISKEKMEEKFK